MIIATEVYTDTIGVGSFSAYVNGQCYATKASTTEELESGPVHIMRPYLDENQEVRNIVKTTGLVTAYQNAVKADRDIMERAMNSPRSRCEGRRESFPVAFFVSSITSRNDAMSEIVAKRGKERERRKPPITKETSLGVAFLLFLLSLSSLFDAMLPWKGEAGRKNTAGRESTFTPEWYL